MSKKKKQDLVTYNQNGELISNEGHNVSIGHKGQVAEIEETFTTETRPDGTVIETQKRRIKIDNKGGLFNFFSR